MNAGEIAICTHAYIYGYTYSNKYTRAHTYICTNPQKYKHTHRHPYSHTGFQTNAQTYIHTHAHNSVLMSLL